MRATSLAHYVAGAITAIATTINPIAAIIGFLGFIIYEVDEDWHLNDKAFHDIKEYMIGYFATLTLLLTLTLYRLSYLPWHAS